MKKFKFFALAFAALSFAACSDDVIDGKGGNTGAAGDGTPAYLTISFSANGGNSSRSTADDANNNGDDHSTDDDPDTPDVNEGNGEDSGHHNDGTADERAVDKVLVVIVPSDGGNVNFAKMYSTTVSGTSTKDEDEFKIVNQASESYVNDSPIELATGKYNVIVVANPVVDLITGISGGDLNAGIENSNVVEDLYTKITTGNYNPTEADYANIAAGNPLTTGTNFRVMMANKGLSTSGQAYTVELTEANVSPNEPAVADIEVERVLSKVTFRETNSNIYEIHPKVGAVRADKVDGAIEVESNWIKTTLNVAFDALENEVYVWVQENQDGERTYTVYGKGSGTHDFKDGTSPVDIYTELQPATISDYESNSTGKYAVADVSNPMASITYKPDDTVTPEQTWYVRLEGYALVNLSKNVHYVRHTISTAGGETPFGVLNGSNYLYTPYWGEKNGINFVEDANGDLQFPAGFDPTTTTDVWFYNTLAKVSAESENMTINAAGEFKLGETTDDAIYYKPMSSLGSDEDGTVTGDDHYETDQTKPGVGKFMAYCFENSTDLDHQTHGLSTGISFVARMYKTNNNGTLSEPVTRLYRYGNNNLFESLAAIQQAFGESFMSDKFNEFVDKEKSEGITSITEQDLASLAEAEDGGEQIELYNDNICYYYTTEIKHFDNGDNSVLGNMEFAIMRNNIYSLAVTGINMVGDPAVVPTPGTPDENPTPEEARLDVQVKILPWIVRYNDIEF